MDVDENTALTISLILACALRFVDYDKRIQQDNYEIDELNGNIQQLREEEEKEKEEEVSRRLSVKEPRKEREEEREANRENRKRVISEAEGMIIGLNDRISRMTTLKHQEMGEVMELLTAESVKVMELLEAESRQSFRLHNGGMRRRTLRRGVKKYTRRERRASIRSRCRSGRWQYRRMSSSSSSSRSGKLKKNTQRCRSRNSKTRRRRTTATRT